MYGVLIIFYSTVFAMLGGAILSCIDPDMITEASGIYRDGENLYIVSGNDAGFRYRYKFGMPSTA